MASEKADEQLLAEFVDGQRAALGELALRYERPLLGLAMGLLGGRRDLAADAIQETWLRVIRFGGQFAGGSRFKTWVYRIAVNQCRNLAVAAGGRRAGEFAGAEQKLLKLPARGGTPEQASSTAERRDLLRRAVEQLDAERRVIVLLCYHAGMTHEDAAEILELPLGTLKSRLHAALEELRATLGALADSDMKPGMRESPPGKRTAENRP